MKRTHSLCGLALVCLFLFSSSGSLWAQTLTVTDGLQLWLRGDAGVTLDPVGGVAQWEDQSGNGNHALQGVEGQAPTLVNAALNSKPVLRFDGADDFLEVADSESLSGTGDMSSFFVVKFDNFDFFNEVWGKTSANYPAPTDIYTSPGSGTLVVVRGNGNDSGLSFTPTGQGLRAAEYLVLGFDVAGEILTHYLNNQENGSGTATLNTADTDTPLRIGTRNDNFTRMKGDIAELLIYSRALTPEERASVFSYLQTKYNLLNLLPTVTLASTPAGPNVTVGQLVTITATAVDLDGSITKVDFFLNGALVGTATTPPYSLPVRIQSAGTSQFTARATDNRQGSTTSLPLILTSGPSGPTELPVTGNLQLWLRADQGTTVGGLGGVTEWADQSGNGNTASQPDENLAPLLAAGAFNGKPALTFDGLDDYLQVADADSISIVGDITTLYVLRFADFTTYRAIWAKTQGNLPAPTDIYTSPGGGVVQVFRGDGTDAGIQNIPGTRGYPAATPILAGWQQEGAAMSHYLNGQPNGGGTFAITPADLDGPLYVGTRADFVTRFSGDLAELLIYDRALSTTERQAAERYLGEKYGLPAVVITANNAPIVTLTSPTGGQVLTAPGNVAVAASASDADGNVASVQFFVNGTALATDTTAPFQATLNLNFGGSVTLSATATDNLGATSSSSLTLCAQGPGAPAGLVGYWPLNGDGAAIVGVNGNLVNGPFASADRNGTAGGALSFDGLQSQRVEIPGGGGLNAAQAGSISMWVKWSGPQDNSCCGPFGTVLARQANGVFSDNVIALSGSDPDAASLQWRQATCCAVTIGGTGIVGNDIWRHIGVTFTATESELFLDGVSEGIGAGAALHDNSSIPLAIGAWVGDGGSYATATIDDVAVWNRVLSAAEIAALAQQSSTPLNLLVTPDCLTIARTGATATVRWGSGAILEQATDITGPWTDVAGATSPYVAPVQGLTRFFRLKSL